MKPSDLYKTELDLGLKKICHFYGWMDGFNIKLILLKFCDVESLCVNWNKTHVCHQLLATELVLAGA